MKMEPTLGLTQVLKEEAEYIGLQGKVSVFLNLLTQK